MQERDVFVPGMIVDQNQDVLSEAPGRRSERSSYVCMDKAARIGRRVRYTGMRVAGCVCLDAVRAGGYAGVGKPRGRVSDHRWQAPHGFDAAMKAHVHNLRGEFGRKARDALAVVRFVETGSDAGRASGGLWGEVARSGRGEKGGRPREDVPDV